MSKATLHALLLLLSAVSLVESQLPAPSDISVEIRSYLEHFIKREQLYESLDFRTVLSLSIPTAFSKSVGERCRNDSLDYAQRIFDPQHPWATQSKSCPSFLLSSFF